jgi:hypothetical protein
MPNWLISNHAAWNVVFVVAYATMINGKVLLRHQMGMGTVVDAVDKILPNDHDRTGDPSFHKAVITIEADLKYGRVLFTELSRFAIKYLVNKRYLLIKHHVVTHYPSAQLAPYEYTTLSHKSLCLEYRSRTNYWRDFPLFVRVKNAKH